MPASRLIAADWGTSSFRAFLLDADGTILDRRDGPHGILSVEKGDFAATLSAEIGGWLGSPGRCPVLLSGMIGSRQGWRETPYIDAPAGIGDLAAGLVPATLESADVRIVPGVRTTAGAMPDVMRGEEVQVLGAMARLGVDGGRFVLPGTHSKWVMTEAGRITGFVTYMTGEIYAALRGHTILGRLMHDGEACGDAFDHGAREGARAGTPGALLNRLFGVRTAGLFDRFSATELPEYLSGLLIGAEIADQLARDARPVCIVASDALAERYRAAAAQLGLPTQALPADCTADGYVAIARLAKLI
jgi:2-dehydro-3-deoxygalactonokinase